MMKERMSGCQELRDSRILKGKSNYKFSKNQFFYYCELGVKMLSFHQMEGFGLQQLQRVYLNFRNYFFLRIIDFFIK